MIIKLCCDETFYKSTQESNEKELLQKKKDCSVDQWLCPCISNIVFVHLDHFRACTFLSSYVAVRALRRFANNKIWRSHAGITSAHVIDHPWSVKKDNALVALLFKALEKSILHFHLNISSWTIAYLVARISDQCGLPSKYQGGEAWIKQLPCNTMLEIEPNCSIPLNCIFVVVDRAQSTVFSNVQR